MNKYIAKVLFDRSFLEGFEGGILDIRDKILSELKKETSYELVNFSFSNFVLTMDAENRQECRSRIEEHWRCAFRGLPSAEVLVSDYGPEEEDKNALIKAIFTAYTGVDDYLRLVTELNEIIPLFASQNALDVFRRQSYLFAVDSGCGFTTLVRSFSDYLGRMMVYPDRGEGERTKFIEFKAGKDEGCLDPDSIIERLRTPADELFESGARIDSEIALVGIDISAYLPADKADDLRRFLRRLAEFGSDYIFAFRIPFLEKRAIDSIADAVSDIMLLRVLRMPPLSADQIVEVVIDRISSHGFDYDVSLAEPVSRFVTREKTDGRFYGFKTAEKIAYEMIFRKNSLSAEKARRGETVEGNKISAEDFVGYPETDTGAVKGYDALAEMIGMEEIACRVKEIVAQVKISIANEKLDHPCIHMRFTGAPGTGKTTVARILGQILREEGVLRKGGLFEYHGRSLVAEYEGQTSVKTASICRDAYGSVLFIDEAYSLNENKSNGADFGKEAIATLVSEMENHRDDMLVIMAGYSDEMDELMKVNPGLRSRMPYVIDFPNYTREQLFRIFMLMVGKHFDFDPQLEQQARDYFLSLSDAYLGSKEFSNGRFVRNFYERTWSKGALRCSMKGSRHIVLTKEDFISASCEKEFSEKLEGSSGRIGF